MDADPGEQVNRCHEDPERARRMVELLRSMVDAGRSTPGETQSNDADVDIWKLGGIPDADLSRWDDY